jgi:outer membrane protein
VRLEKQIVNFRHLQAAACVAMTLLSVVPQCVAQAGSASQQAQAGAAPLAAFKVLWQQNGGQQNGQQSTAGQTGSQVNPTKPATPQAVQNDTTGAPGLPQAPEPKPTEPFYLRPTSRDYTLPMRFLPNPIRDYAPTNYPAPRLSNTPGLGDLLRDGKIYLSLSDAVTLALENNYDIAIARINLDIADTDILRARAGTTLRGVSTGLVTNTLGGTTSTITGGGGPGGTTNAAGGGGAGSSGLVLSTNGGGPLPELLDPALTGNIEYESARTHRAVLSSPERTHWRRTSPRTILDTHKASSQAHHLPLPSTTHVPQQTASARV